MFDNFTRSLKTHQQRLDDLETGITAVLTHLSRLELMGPHGWLPAMSTGDVDGLMRAAHRIHKLGHGIAVESRATDVAIKIARKADGSVFVFPALPA